MSFLTCFWLFPQKEHLSRSPPSPMRATRIVLPESGCARWARVSRRYPLGPTWGPAARDRRAAAPEPPRPAWPVTPSRHAWRLHGGSADEARLTGCGERVDEAVVDRFLRGQDLVALDVLADLVDVSAGVAGEDLLEQRTHTQDLVGLDLDVPGCAVGTLGVRLVDQHPGVRHREPLARGTGREQDGGGRGGLPHADRADIGLDELHSVVDRRHRRERTARRVDVDLDVTVGIHG